jgi:hypothetical protein
VAPFQRHGSAARGAAYDYRCRLQKRCRSSADSCKFSGIFFLYMVFSVKDHIQHSANSSDTRIDLRFAASFAALSVYAVRKFKQKRSFYVSFVITAFLTALIVFFTYSNILVQKIINMVLQTSLGAPTPLPWFFPLFSLMIFLDVYSFLVSVKRRSLSMLSMATGATMIFTSVYLPYNMLYV